jgi:hypothetical protein
MLNFYGKKEFFEFICIFMCFCMDFGGLDVPWSSDSHHAFHSLIMIIFWRIHSANLLQTKRQAFEKTSIHFLLSYTEKIQLNNLENSFERFSRNLIKFSKINVIYFKVVFSLWWVIFLMIYVWWSKKCFPLENITHDNRSRDNERINKIFPSINLIFFIRMCTDNQKPQFIMKFRNCYKSSLEDTTKCVSTFKINSW